MLLLIGSIAVGNAQTFTWGKAAPSQNETDAKLSHLDEGKFYAINSKYNENVFNRDVNVNVYGSNLDREKTNVLSVEQPAMGKAMMTHREMFQVKGTDYIIFLDEYNNKTKETALYIQHVDIDSGVKGERQQITSIPGRSSNYGITQSPNGKFYAVNKFYGYDKKLNEKINLALLDKDFKIVREVSFETPYMNKTPMENQFYVSDQGMVYMVKNIDLAKAKPFKTVFVWDGNSQTMQETSLKFDNDYQIYQYQGHFDGSDFYLHGFYTRIGSKGVQVYGGGVPANGIYAAKFNSKGEKVYTVASETAEIPGLNLKDFILAGEKTWFVADEMFVSKKAKPLVQGSFNFEYDYTYKNMAIAVGKIDNETGKLEWNKVLKFDEPDTTNDNGAFLSFLYLIKNNQLVLLYNDTQKTKVGPRIMNDRFTAIEIYDDRGNQVSQNLIGGTGLELKYNSANDYYEENFDLDTSENIIATKDGKYIVRAKSGSNEKYGYITF